MCLPSVSQAVRHTFKSLPNPVSSHSYVKLRISPVISIVHTTVSAVGSSGNNWFLWDPGRLGSVTGGTIPRWPLQNCSLECRLFIFAWSALDYCWPFFYLLLFRIILPSSPHPSFFSFLSGFKCAALTGLELTLLTRLAWNSHRSTCLSLPNTETIGMHLCVGYCS